jgi:hypothetical protein
VVVFQEVFCRFRPVTDILTSVRPTLTALRFTSRAKVGASFLLPTKTRPVTASIIVCPPTPRNNFHDWLRQWTMIPRGIGIDSGPERKWTEG